MTSRLPENPRYWEQLTQRLVADAREQLGGYRSATRRRSPGLARLSIPLAIAAAAAVIIALLYRPDSVRDSAGISSPARVYGFTPTDPLAAVFVASAGAPTMATLLSTPTSERTQ